MGLRRGSLKELSKAAGLDWEQKSGSKGCRSPENSCAKITKTGNAESRKIGEDAESRQRIESRGGGEGGVRSDVAEAAPDQA
jgi:hypothetical protein